MVIDELIRKIAAALGKASIPRLSQTTLTTLEYSRINDIMNYKLAGGLWDTALNSLNSMETGEKKQVELAGKEMISANLIVDKPNAYLAFFRGQSISLNTDE